MVGERERRGRGARLTAAVTVSAGVMSLALGALFLAASQGEERRVLVAAVGLGVGAVLTGAGAWLLKHLGGPGR